MRTDILRTGVLALVLTAGATVATVADAATVELVSRADPLPDSNGTSLQPALSEDGRYAAFVSNAPNLVPGQVDDNADYDVFLHDRLLGTTVLVSHAPGSPNRAAPLDRVSVDGPELPAISADGRYVVFTSTSTGVVPGVTEGNFSRDVFLYDRVTGVNTLVSHAAGSPATTADSRSGSPRISADGRYVVFTSTATDLVAGQTGLGTDPPTPDVFLWERASNTVTLVSRKSGTAAMEANDGSNGFGLSANGDFVLFTSGATDLLPNVSDPVPSLDVFVYQRSSNAVFLVSRASGAPTTAAGADGVLAPVLSADGRYVAFTSRSTNLVPGQVDGDFTPDAFLFDRVSGEMRLASRTSASPQTAGGLVEFVDRGFSMSANGRYVAFVSPATNLVPGQVDTNQSDDVFVYDRITGTTALASHTQGSPATATADRVGAGSPSFSADGRFLAFTSGAVDLAVQQTDTRFTADVFLYDQTSGRATLVSRTRGSATTAANSHSFLPVISADGGVVAFTSLATNLGEGQADANGYEDLFLYHRSSGEIASASRRDPDLPIVTPIGASTARALSSDGRFILFLSRAPGLVPGQIDQREEIDEFGTLISGTIDVFLRDQVAGRTTLLSRSLSSPLQAVGGAYPVLAPDGRFAAFSTTSSSGGPLYLYDRVADSLTLVNHVPGSATQADSGFVLRSSISADGRFLAYECLECGLVPGHSPRDSEGNRTSDVFLYDRTTGANILVSRAAASSGGAGGDGPSRSPRISPDGRFVVFASEATNLVAGQSDTPRTGDLFLFDRTAGTTTLLSHVAGSATRAAGGTFVDFSPVGLSLDGRFIAFPSQSANLVPGQVDTNDDTDLFLHDRVLGTTVLVSHAASSALTAGSRWSGSLSFEDGEVPISTDGRFLVYESLANDLVAGLTDANGLSPDVFLYDRLAGTNTLVSHAGGAPLRTGDRYSSDPRISADGSRIAFLSTATDLVPGQTAPAAFQHLYVQDRTSGRTTLIGQSRVLTNPLVSDTLRSFEPRLSADGRRIAFTSDAAFVPGDLNRNLDVYLWKDDGGTPGGPIPLPACKLLDTRRRADRPVLTSNVQRAVTARGACGVPATAKQVRVNVTVFNPSGKGNLRFYPGAVTANPSGILRFERNATRTETFTLPLSANGTLTVLPFVASRGTVHVAVEVTGYAN